MNMHPGPHWKHHRPHWPHEMPEKRRFLYGRFVFFFGGLVFFFLLALVVVISLAFGPLQEALPRTALILLLLCGVPFGFVLLAGMLGGWTFRRYAKPLAEVMAAADAVAEGDLSVRVSEAPPGELGRLAHSFNRMTSELERAEQQRRNLTADVAHELRTPLHVIQGNLEGIQDGVYQPNPDLISATLDEARLLGRLVSDLQTLSLAEAGQLPLHKIPVSAADLLQDAVTGFSPQAAEAGVELRLALEGDLQALEIEVDPQRVDQVLNNLIANALRHTPPGGYVRLGAAAFPGGVRLTVQDSGSGILPEDLPFVFDRFWKGDRARLHRADSGSGLGLAIVKQLVQAHGGTIEVVSEPGVGSLFTIELYR